MQPKNTTGLTYPILCGQPPSPLLLSPPMQSNDTACRSYPIIVCLPPAPSPPPSTDSKSTTGLTASEIQAQRRAERNEKSRLRMARKRAELKTRPWEEQQQAAARSRAHRATYREKNREALKNAEALRRATLHERKFGEAARAAYEEARRKRTGP
ncbi:hypothetical protein FB451DRAFT_732861 [Mycena latifolia]|nr:hypothetical protein FB451DRAFT_732861 [Mycena latifolia]